MDNHIKGALLVCLAATMWGFDGIALTPRLFNLHVPFVVFILHLLPLILMSIIFGKEEIKKEIEHEIGKYGYSLFIFVVTDIINSNSLLFVYGKEIDLVQNAFKKDVVDNEVLLENVVSRKKQIIPFLMTAAQNM